MTKLVYKITFNVIKYILVYLLIFVDMRIKIKFYIILRWHKITVIFKSINQGEKNGLDFFENMLTPSG